MEIIIIFTDGGARGNPGPAGAGAVIVREDGVVLKEVAQYLGEQTNNWAEYEAVVLGLEAAKKLFGASKLKEMQVEVKSDSELIVEQLSNRYQIKKETLFSQFIKVHNMQIAFLPNIIFTHVPREQNKEADRLVNQAIDQEINKDR